MRYCLIFSMYPGSDWNYMTNAPLAEGLVYRNVHTAVELLQRGLSDYELRIDAVPIGLLTAIVRDRIDEASPAEPGADRRE